MKKWYAEIIGALAECGPSSALELTVRVLGPLPHPKYVAFQMALRNACDDGEIERIGSAAHGPNRYRYVLSGCSSGLAQLGKDV